MNERLHIEDWPGVIGVPGLVQGAYGSAGNLELVAPASDQGLWVGWFNTDAHENFSGPARDRWSGALRFGLGRRYISAKISQVQVGHNALEVLALTADGILARHVWREPQGFEEMPVVYKNALSATGIVVMPDGTHSAVVVNPNRAVCLLQGDVRSYPLWDPAEISLPYAADYVDAALHSGHLEVLTVSNGVAHIHCPTQGTVGLGKADTALLVVDSAQRRWILRHRGSEATLHILGDRYLESEITFVCPAATAMASIDISQVSGVDIVYRRDNSLHHLRITPDGAGLSRPVRAEVWLPDDSGTSPLPPVSTVHRGL